MVGEWTPLRLRNGGDEEDYGGPHEGVPPWLSTSLQTWLRYALRRVGTGPEVVHYAERMERRLRRWVILTPDLRSTAPRLFEPLFEPPDKLAEEVARNPDLLLDVIDYVLNHPPEKHGAWEAAVGGADPNEFFDSLEEILREGGSVWTVGAGGGWVGLQRRVLREVDAAARAAMAGSDEPARLLSEAWRHAYGRHPNPGAAYAEAIKAVEAVAQPVISPNDSKATLGKMAKAMQDRPSKWAVRLDTQGDLGVGSVAQLFRLLMRGHAGRHGSAQKVTVTQPEAESAVHVAVLLVQWFRTRTIVEAPEGVRR